MPGHVWYGAAKHSQFLIFVCSVVLLVWEGCAAKTIQNHTTDHNTKQSSCKLKARTKQKHTNQSFGYHAVGLKKFCLHPMPSPGGKAVVDAMSTGLAGASVPGPPRSQPGLSILFGVERNPPLDRFHIVSWREKKQKKKTVEVCRV